MPGSREATDLLEVGALDTRGIGVGQGAEVVRITKGVGDKPDALFEFLPEGLEKGVLQIVGPAGVIVGIVDLAQENGGRGRRAVPGSVHAIKIPGNMAPLSIGPPPDKVILGGVIPGAHPVEQGHGSQGGLDIKIGFEPRPYCRDIGRRDDISSGAPRCPQSIQHGFQRGGAFPGMVLQRIGVIIALPRQPTGEGPSGGDRGEQAFIPLSVGTFRQLEGPRAFVEFTGFFERGAAGDVLHLLMIGIKQIAIILSLFRTG